MPSATDIRAVSRASAPTEIDIANDGAPGWLSGGLMARISCPASARLVREEGVCEICDEIKAALSGTCPSRLCGSSRVVPSAIRAKPVGSVPAWEGIKKLRRRRGAIAASSEFDSLSCGRASVSASSSAPEAAWGVYGGTVKASCLSMRRDQRWRSPTPREIPVSAHPLPQRHLFSGSSQATRIILPGK